LRRLGAQIAGVGVAGTDVRREHQIERVDGLTGQPRTAVRADEFVLGDDVLDFGDGEALGVLVLRVVLDDVIRAVALAALGTLDEHVVEAVQMARGLEDGFGMIVGASISMLPSASAKRSRQAFSTLPFSAAPLRAEGVKPPTPPYAPEDWKK